MWKWPQGFTHLSSHIDKARRDLKRDYQASIYIDIFCLLQKYRKNRTKKVTPFWDQVGTSSYAPQKELKRFGKKILQRCCDQNQGQSKLWNTDTILKGGDSLPQPDLLQCFPDLMSHTALHKSSLPPRISGLFEVLQTWPNSLVYNNSNSKISA